MLPPDHSVSPLYRLPVVYLICLVFSPETVDRMGATRAYEANVAAVGAVKGVAMKALEIGRA